ncbi:MAG: CAP domain-containing protein [Rhodobacteraceae bacterium]|nr:CAP domain-containing protein [Paracoccaceae bacterium]
MAAELSVSVSTGLAPLAADPVLARVAAGHACDMARGDYFAHRDRAGRSPGDRVRAAGIEHCATAENIAVGQPDAAAVQADWMASSGHRANILRHGARRVGVAAAVAPGGDGLVRWVAVFAGPCL